MHWEANSCEIHLAKLRVAIMRWPKHQIKHEELGSIHDIAMGTSGHIPAIDGNYVEDLVASRYHHDRAGGGAIGEEEEEGGYEEELQEEERGIGEEYDFDASTGVRLDPHLVRQAKQEELEYADSIPLYTLAPTDECMNKTGKAPVSTKWTVLNRGDKARPEIRARWVARDFNRYEIDDFYASTPPWELIRLVLSVAPSQGDPRGKTQGQRKGWKKVGLIDISRAYFHTPVEEDIYVDLPPERQVPGMCGKFQRYLCGMRGAARAFQQHVAKQMKQWGLRQTMGCSCLFTHWDRDAIVIIHGDDFVYLVPTTSSICSTPK